MRAAKVTINGEQKIPGCNRVRFTIAAGEIYGFGNASHRSANIVKEYLEEQANKYNKDVLGRGLRSVI